MTRPVEGQEVSSSSELTLYFLVTKCQQKQLKKGRVGLPGSLFELTTQPDRKIMVART